jgi:hypothetical protein
VRAAQMPFRRRQSLAQGMPRGMFGKARPDGSHSTSLVLHDSGPQSESEQPHFQDDANTPERALGRMHLMPVNIAHS